MFTGITGHVGAVVATIVVLTGGAALRGGAATADPNQDEQFKALLDQEDIPALEGVPTLINTAHKICLVLDRGIPVDTVVDAMMNNAYTQDPAERLYPPARLESTMTRFITASVEAYCPRNQRKIASIAANPAAPAANASMHPAAAYLHRAASDLGQKAASTGVVGLPRLMDSGPFVAPGTALASLIRTLPSGDMTPPTPPQIPPPPPPPQAHLQAPPRPIAAPPAPKRPPPPPQQLPPPPQQPPPPPQQPPPPPEQVQPPANAPQPGGDAGSGGGGGSGGTGGAGGGGGTAGAGPVAPPAPAMPPGFVRLAP